VTQPVATGLSRAALASKLRWLATAGLSNLSSRWMSCATPTQGTAGHEFQKFGYNQQGSRIRLKLQ
jgi:hypothetical protein